jgi:hypothetical protein
MPPLTGPEVKYIVKINIIQQQPDTSALSGSFFCGKMISSFQHTVFMPLANMALAAPISLMLFSYSDFYI